MHFFTIIIVCSQLLASKFIFCRPAVYHHYALLSEVFLLKVKDKFSWDIILCTHLSLMYVPSKHTLFYYYTALSSEMTSQMVKHSVFTSIRICSHPFLAKSCMQICLPITTVLLSGYRRRNETRRSPLRTARKGGAA